MRPRCGIPGDACESIGHAGRPDVTGIDPSSRD